MINMNRLPRTLTLNDDEVKQLPEPKRAVFIFEWLRYLETMLPTAQKAEIKTNQKKLVEQLTELMQGSPGPPTRKLIANSLATLYSVGDTFLLFDTVNACNDILKNKDDSPSFLPKKLSAICVLGCMYEKLGRMMGRSYEETVQLLVRTLRNAESQARIEIMITFEKVCAGMGTAITNVHKDIYKAAKHCLLDRVMAVRVAAAKCILEMLNNAQFLYQTELENLATLCFRAFDGSNYEVRCAVASLLGTLLAVTQKSPDSENKKNNSQQYVQQNAKSAQRSISLDEALGLLMSGFLRGGVSFLKGTGEMIKGSSSVNREVRVGVTHAYVVLVQYLGSVWLERNLSTFLSHTLDLVANPKAASSHVDAVYSRKCINFILRSVIGKILGEKAQMSACKELIHLIAKQMNSIDFHPENAKDSNQETLFSQHLLVCALQELGSLVIGLGTTAQNIFNDQSLNAIDATCAVLVHPCAAARLAAAWCLRCYCVAVPSQITPLIDRFVDGIEQVRSSPEATAGYSCALAAILGSVRYSPLGIPHTKGKVVFNCAEELLRSASQNSRMSLHRTQAGWLLIGAIMTLGSSVVKGLLPRMLLLWRNSFPRSNKELDSEKARGDAFTWQVTLEGRAGALSVMHSFLLNCSDLVTEDITKRLLTPIESALAMLVNLAPVLKSYGTQLKAPAAMVRFRLFETLTLLPPSAMEPSYTFLLRMLVAEFTLADNPANTTNSLLRNLCHGNDSIILGTWLQESDHCSIEDQMEPNRRFDGEHLQPNSAAGSGALEHDPCCLYRATYAGIYPVTTQLSLSVTTTNFNTSKAQQCPGPLPLGVAVIDMSVTLFGLIFPKVANKHRVQVLEHFAECIKQSKSSRQEAVQMNIFTALLSGLKGLTDSKASIGQEDVKKSATNLILGALVSVNATLRCAAGEALGRMAQVVGDSHYTAELAQNSFDKLKSARDVVTRTGHSHALGCLHRYVGGMSSSQHLGTSVSILLALAQDSSSPVVQVWSLYALALIADSGGPMFRSYVEATLTLCLKLLLTVPHASVDVHQCAGRVLNALITTVGPELQAQTGVMSEMRTSFLCAAALMQAHSDPLVQAESIGCLQQLHLFAPKYVNLSSLVPTLVHNLASNYFILRKAAVSCLRQLAHREAKEVCELALNAQEQMVELLNTDFGLPGLMFSMLDSETDAEMLRNLHDTLTSMLQALAADNLTLWLSLCKNVLTVAADNATLQQDELALKNETPNAHAGLSENSNKVDLDEDEDIDDDDVAEYHAEENNSTHPAVQPRWPTRVFAAQCVRKIMTTCELVSPVHFDLIQAKALLLKSRVDYLVMHLSELIRMAFMAATSDSDQLRLEGLRTLQEIIDKFANVPEPEFAGHLLLEQFQAQVGAALRPAFSADTPSHVTAAACEVCSAWIGSGVARDLNDLRRVHQLLVSSLNKLQTKTNSTQLYNESMATLEKLSILKAWAEVYIVAMIGNNSAPASVLQKKLKAVSTISPLTYSSDEGAAGINGDFESRGESLLSLVKPELQNLSTHWLAAMKDHALLLLPAEFQSQLPHDGGAFYTTDTINSAKPHYLSSWPPILYAAALWLRDEGFAMHINTSSLEQTNDPIDDTNNNITHGSLSADRFHMIFGICIEALCSTRSTEKPKNVLSCLKSLYTIFDSEWARQQLVKDRTLTIELCNVLHRQILTQDNLLIQLICMEILKQSIEGVREDMNKKCDAYLQENKTTNTAESIIQNQLELLGEGGDTGELMPGESHVYAVLEVCLCVFVRQIPCINPSNSGNTNKMGGISFKADFPTMSNSSTAQSFFSTLGEDNGLLVACGLQCIEHLPALCSPKGALAILPSLLYMTTSIIREVANKSSIDSTILANTPAIKAALNCLKSVCIHKWSKHEQVTADWMKLLQSALATILDLTKTADDNEDRRMDEVTMLLAIAVFILHTPSSVVSMVSLQYPCINHFRQCTLSENLFVKLECIQTMRSIFAKADLKISTPYIHALAPRIIECLYAAVNKPPTSDMELRVLIECILTVETLIELAEPQNRIQMLTLLVPVLINYLADQTKLRTLPKYHRHLHEHSLQWLMKIGPKYPQEFKALMGQTLELRQKLEMAIRQQQSINTSNRQSGSDMANRDANSQQQKPSIQLKTDFSNFH